MRRALPLLLGGCLMLFFACYGASDSDTQRAGPSAQEEGLKAEDVTKKECPWASAEDSSCAVGTSEAACGNGTGKCGISGTAGCTCIKSTVIIQPQPPVTANSVRTQPPEDVAKKECPWAASDDPSCAPGTSEASCSGGTGKCRVSGSAGCTCVSNTVATPVEQPPVLAP